MERALTLILKISRKETGNKIAFETTYTLHETFQPFADIGAYIDSWKLMYA